MKLTAKQYTEAEYQGLTPYWHKLGGFAEACYNQNSFEDLKYFQKAVADKGDCEQWGLTDQEWRDAQQQAIELAMVEHEEDI